MPKKKSRIFRFCIKQAADNVYCSGGDLIIKKKTLIYYYIYDWILLLLTVDAVKSYDDFHHW